MKRLRSKLTEQKGEMLIESVCSMLIFLLLLMVISVMIVTSLRITDYAVQTATEAQTAVNSAALQRYQSRAEQLTLTSSTPGARIDVVIGVTVTADDAQAVAFDPEVRP